MEHVPLLQAFFGAQRVVEQAFCIWYDGFCADLLAVAAVLRDGQTAAEPDVQRCLLVRRRAKQPMVDERAPVPPCRWYCQPATWSRASRVLVSADCAQKLCDVVHPLQGVISPLQIAILPALQLPAPLAVGEH